MLLAHVLLNCFLLFFIHSKLMQFATPKKENVYIYKNRHLPLIIPLTKLLLQTTLWIRLTIYVVKEIGDCIYTAPVAYTLIVYSGERVLLTCALCQRHRQTRLLVILHVTRHLWWSHLYRLSPATVYTIQSDWLQNYIHTQLVINERSCQG